MYICFFDEFVGGRFSNDTCKNMRKEGNKINEMSKMRKKVNRARSLKMTTMNRNKAKKPILL